MKGIREQTKAALERERDGQGQTSRKGERERETCMKQGGGRERGGRRKE